MRKMISKLMGKKPDKPTAEGDPVEKTDQCQEEYEAAKKEADEALQQLKTRTMRKASRRAEDTGEFSDPLPIAAG